MSDLEELRPDQRENRSRFTASLSTIIRHRRLIFLIALIVGLAVFLFSLPPQTRSAIRIALFTQRALLSLLFIFGLLTVSLVWSAGQRIDALVFLYLNVRGRRPKWLDRFMWAATQLGNFIFALALAAIFYLANFRRLAIEIILGMLTLWLMVEAIKFLTDRGRPFVILVEARVVGWKERGRSFPSGHTSQAFFIATLLIHYFQIEILGSLVIYGLAALVGFTRMYTGAHYPRDVMGGAVLGSVWGILGGLIDIYLFRRI